MPMGYLSPQFSFASPKFGADARVVPARCTIDTTGAALTVNLAGMPPGQQLDAIATLYVDNSNGPLPLVILYPDTEMSVDVPAYTQGYFQGFTNGLVFSLSAPLIAEYGSPITVPIQILNFPVALQPLPATPPSLNEGTILDIGTSAGWTSFAFDVPGVQQIFNSVELDNSTYSQPITLGSTDLSGDPWTVTVPGFVSAEFLIPPTVSGVAGVATTATPTVAGTTEAVIVSKWRSQPAGVVRSTSLPANQTAISALTASPASGNNDANVPLPTGFGGYVASVTVFGQALTQACTVELIDNSGVSPPATVFWTGVFPVGSYTFSAPVGWCTKFRGGNITLRGTFPAGSTGTLIIQITWSPVAASQNG
jgi:hypothetical protein